MQVTKIAAYVLLNEYKRLQVKLLLFTSLSFMEIGGSDPPILTSALNTQTKSSPVSIIAGYAPQSV
jgi:hypothetical protein